jgi:Reverse transcriptase (RNA-dependent DNA polymerase)
MNSLCKPEAYKEVKRENRKVLGRQWVLTTKMSPEGQQKGSIYYTGKKQIPGLEFLNTFSIALCKESSRFLVSKISSKGMIAVQMDISSAFLDKDVYYKLYIELPSVVYTKTFRETNIGLNKDQYMVGNRRHACGISSLMRKLILLGLRNLLWILVCILLLMKVS